MADNVMQLNDFLVKLTTEAPIRLTWLVGAGMSVSAGMPLAEGISDRIILFDYFVHQYNLSSDYEGKGKPWRTTDLTPVTYSDFGSFLDWYQSLDGEQLTALKTESIAHLQSQEGFEKVTSQTPQCYPLLFAKKFLSNDNAHLVLTEIVKRGNGINLAHLALAGLMRDHAPKVGHTVFTTNFDDLLLKAFLALNHSARVFGELKSHDLPVLHPTYPQIVHLHGRHTGYRLSNTKEQLRLHDPSLKDGFVSHIRDSHLIVLGYSGWDDLAMEVLRELTHNDNLLRGLFWVPYQGVETMADEVRKFISDCPPHKARIIVNPQQPLDADRFMLALCRAVNREHGFQKYRSDIIHYATNQHRFCLEQLKKHPEDDPLVAVELAKKGLRQALAGNRSAASAALAKATRRVRPDVPAPIRAEALLTAAVADMALGSCDSAEKLLAEAELLWEGPDTDPTTSAGRFRTHMAMGICYLRLDNLEKAKGTFVEARRVADRVNDRDGRARALAALGSVTMRGDPQAALIYFSKALQAATPGTLATVEIQRLAGDAYRAMAKVPEARGCYEAALGVANRLGDEVTTAILLKSLGDLDIANDLKSANARFAHAEGLLATTRSANAEAQLTQSYGDRCVFQDDLTGAIEHYQTACAAFAACGSTHSANSLRADLIVRWLQATGEQAESRKRDALAQLRSLSETTGNRYAFLLAEALGDSGEQREITGDASEPQA